MDFGSLVQTKRNPRWDICPLTAKAIMKTHSKNFPAFAVTLSSSKGDASMQKEPGRLIGATFIPNRIFRGRIIDALRDAPQGLTLHSIGKQIALDWKTSVHRDWLQKILQQLTRESMLAQRKGKYILG